MASVTGVDFLASVPIGHDPALRAWVSRADRSSMSVCVTGLADAPGIPAEKVLKGVFEMAAIDGHGRPAAIDRSFI